jgi:hypothetical protein
MKMGTYHFLDGARVRVFYNGNEKTCGRCHQGQSGCPGGGLSKECEKEGGVRRLLTDHMRKLWAEINFTPTSFDPIFLRSPAPKSLFATALLNGEMSPEDIATPAGGEKRDASQLSPNSPQAPPKKEIKSGIPVGFGAMPGQK